MMPIEHPWEEWQEDTEELYGWKWKENTPKEIKEQYNEWNQCQRCQRCQRGRGILTLIKNIKIKCEAKFDINKK